MIFYLLTVEALTISGHNLGSLGQWFLLMFEIFFYWHIFACPLNQWEKICMTGKEAKHSRSQHTSLWNRIWHFVNLKQEENSVRKDISASDSCQAKFNIISMQIVGTLRNSQRGAAAIHYIITQLKLQMALCVLKILPTSPHWGVHISTVLLANNLLFNKQQQLSVCKHIIVE